MTPAPAPWAVSPRLHVFLTFMLQFLLLIGLGGGVVPTLHSRGYSWALLIPAAIVVLVLLLYLLALLGKLLPVRCRQCQSRSRYQGFGWWPFIYRYDCAECGTRMRYEIG